MKLSPITVERLGILIAHMDTRVNPMFTMGLVNHGCGTPGCAWGEAKTLAEFKPFLRADAIRKIDAPILFDITGHQNDELFGALMHIKTPQEWSDHARNWLRANGAEPIVSGKESEAQVDTVKASGTEQSASQSARPAASDPFAAFMAEVLKPVDCVNS